jgi:hypothetical protein
MGVSSFIVEWYAAASSAAAFFLEVSIEVVDNRDVEFVEGGLGDDDDPPFTLGTLANFRVGIEHCLELGKPTAVADFDDSLSQDWC